MPITGKTAKLCFEEYESNISKLFSTVFHSARPRVTVVGKWPKKTKRGQKRPCRATLIVEPIKVCTRSHGVVFLACTQELSAEWYESVFFLHCTCDLITTA